MSAIRFNFTLEEEVAQFLQTFSKGKRSKVVNTILKEYAQRKLEQEMAEGFNQSLEDFKYWEQSGHELWT